MFNSKVEQAYQQQSLIRDFVLTPDGLDYQQQSLISDFVLTPDGLEATLIKNNHLLETNSSSERNDSDIESIYGPWDVVDDALLEAIFNCQLSGSQAIRKIHEIKTRNEQNNMTELETSTELAPLNNEPPRLSSGGAVVPSNENNYQSKVDANYSLDDSILHGTETSASLEFLYDETKLDHLLSTCIEKFDLLSQFTANGVCGFFMIITRFIYGLYRLNFFFL